MKRNPEIDPFKPTELDRRFEGIPLEKLYEMVSSMRLQGNQPLAASSALVTLGGIGIEKYYGYHGVSQVLAHDVDVLLTLEPIIPDIFVEYSPALTLIAKIFQALARGAAPLLLQNGTPPSSGALNPPDTTTGSGAGTNG